MTLEEYLSSLGVYGNSLEMVTKRNLIEFQFFQLKKFGMIQDQSVVEPISDGKIRRIRDVSEISLAIREVNRSDCSFYQSAMRFLYGILKMQNRFDEFQDLLPHTLDMLNSLVYLRFQYFPFFDMTRRDIHTRNIISYVLPYMIARGEVFCKDFYTRMRARIEGYEILKYYYYNSFLASSSDEYIPSTSIEFLEVLLKGVSLKRPFMESIIRTIYQNVEDIIHCENEKFISSIYPLSFNQNEKNDKFHYMMFPEVTLIYACSVMGDTSIESLFDFDLSFLKKHTVTVYQQYHKIMNV